MSDYDEWMYRPADVEEARLIAKGAIRAAATAQEEANRLRAKLAEAQQREALLRELCGWFIGTNWDGRRVMELRALLGLDDAPEGKL